MPLEGGTIESVIVTTGPHARRVPIYLKGDQIWPQRAVCGPIRSVTIDVVVKRPGWSAWLNGKTQKLHMTMVTPVASLKQHYLTLKAGEPVTLKFKAPVRTFSYGEPGNLVRRVLHSPLTVIKLKRTGAGGHGAGGGGAAHLGDLEARSDQLVPGRLVHRDRGGQPGAGHHDPAHTQDHADLLQDRQHRALGNHRPPV